MDYEFAHSIAEEITGDNEAVRVIDCNSGAVVYGERHVNGVARHQS